MPCETGDTKAVSIHFMIPMWLLNQVVKFVSGVVVGAIAMLFIAAIVKGIWR